jgi:hypothetical protein
MAPVDFRKLAGLSIIRLTFSILIRAVHQYALFARLAGRVLSSYRLQLSPPNVGCRFILTCSVRHRTLPDFSPCACGSGTLETNHAPVQNRLQIACHMSESGTFRT